MSGEDRVQPHFDDDFALEVVHELRSAAEIAHAVEHARTCVECDHRLRLAAADRERFRARSEGVLAAFADGRPARPRRRGAIAVLLAAAAAAAIVTTVVLQRPTTPASGLLALPAQLEIIHLRSREQPAELPRLEEAIARYGRGDWAGAREGLEAPFAEKRFESLRRLYLASVLLELGRPERARAVLDEIGTAALPDPYDDWRDWARLRTSPEMNDAGRADSVVRVLAGRPGPLQENARRLLTGESESPAQVPQ